MILILVKIVDKERNQIKGYFLYSSYTSLIDSIIGKKEAKKNNYFVNILALEDCFSD